MSTYYYLVCKDCKEQTGVIGKSHGVYYGSDKVNKEVADFLAEHEGHHLSYMSEHAIDSWKYPEGHWPGWGKGKDGNAESN